MNQDDPLDTSTEEMRPPADHSLNEPNTQTSQHPVELEKCPEGPVTHVLEIIDNLPYLVMILTGSAIFRLALDAGPWRWFAAQFRKHIPVIVPLWFVPLVAGGIPLVRDFSWLLLGFLLVFAVDSFVILPLVSKKYGCAQCPQKEACPWMGTCRTGTE